MYEMLIRKKALKIQERLGMRIGIAHGTSKLPLTRNTNDVLTILRELYKIGLKAFVLPPELFSGIKTTSDLYKTHYGNLLKIKDIANKSNIELSIHNPRLPEDPVALDETLKTFSAITSIMDCRALIIHPTFYKMMPQDQALKLVVYKINEIVTGARANISIGIETTGRMNEVGSLEDVIDIVKRTRSTEPVINWAHIHARGSGALRTQNDFKVILDKVRSNIGPAWLQGAYFFFSGVSYGPSGEIKHIPLEKADINLEYLIREVMSLNIRGTLIFEDPGRDKFILDMLDTLADMVR
jgi:deoxyribonuclease-4